ncbi:MAG: hypothetical protein MUC38_14655 [Cyclobacteriaceae bacterium]|jgi:hypothetical protein|nr:hypothetical protein [Cyclobacteriaceae bacterium]
MSKSLFLILVMAFPAQRTFAQVVNFGRGNENSILTDVRGEPFSERKFSDVEGHPFLNENWQLASITLANGPTYDRLPIRINTANQQVHYRSPGTGRELVLDRTHISKVVVQDSIEKTKHTFAFFYDNSGNVLIAEILVEGISRLLRVDKKVVQEEKLFNSASTHKKFQSAKYYYVFKDKVLHPLKRPDKDLMELFKDRAADIQNLWGPKKKIKREQEMMAIVELYNRLQEGQK